MVSGKLPRSLVEAVLMNPEIYTIHGTFEESVAFLKGYVSALPRGFALGKASDTSDGGQGWLNMPIYKAWHEVTENLRAQTDYQSPMVYDLFRLKHASDVDATAALLAIFRKYIDEHEE